VTGGRQGTCSGEYLIHWNVIDTCLWLLSISLWHEPDEWELNIKLLGLAVIHHVGCLVPSGAFDVEAETVDTINWLLCHVLRLNFIIDLEVIGELINGNSMLSSEVLSGTSEESLREEETREPESCWASGINPSTDKLESIIQISHPRRQWLKGEEADFAECCWHLVVEHGCSEGVEVFVHHNFSLKSELDLPEHLVHDDEESVVSNDLLGKYCVHRLIVHRRVSLNNSFIIKNSRSLFKNLHGKLTNYVFS
jgi:hypothetical protein